MQKCILITNLSKFMGLSVKINLWLFDLDAMIPVQQRRYIDPCALSSKPNFVKKDLLGLGSFPVFLSALHLIKIYIIGKRIKTYILPKLSIIVIFLYKRVLKTREFLERKKGFIMLLFFFILFLIYELFLPTKKIICSTNIQTLSI